MIPGSRSSARSKPAIKYEPYAPEGPDIFTQSFYQQKISSAQSYQSLEFVKRYTNETNLSMVVEKVMQIVLNLQKLPHNPYNLMYRLIHHEAIYENMKRHYSQEKESGSFINYTTQQQDYSSSPDNLQNADQFMTLKLREHSVFFNQQLANYLNPCNLFVFSKIVYPKKSKERLAAFCQKFNIADVHLSLGGPILLNLRGNGGVLDVPVKLPRQIPQKSIYCAQSMLTTTVYVQLNRQLSKCFADFVDFILEDVKQSMQYKDQNHTIYFQRLELQNVDDVFSLIQFSREQIINNVGIVQKELVRSLSRENLTIRSKNVYRLSKELGTVVGEELIKVSKQYVLVAQQNQISTLVSNSPLRYLLKQVFLSEKIIDLIAEHPEYAGKHFESQFKKQMAYHLIYEMKMQNISFACWEMFYYLVYEDTSTPQKRQFVDELFQTISHILLSPMSFVQKLKHTLKSVQWLTIPSFPTYSEQQAYASIISLERDITIFIQKGDYIYWQLQVFYQAIKRLLSIIVEFKQLKLSSINFIVDHALLILQGVTGNFNQILVVLQGSIVSYINLIKESLPQREYSRTILFYEEFLKGKQLPNRVLRVTQEAKKLKKQLSIAESEVKNIIKAKYVARYNFYQKIYQFYWQLITGKKVMFPLSGFLKLLMMNSTQCSYQFFKDNYVRPKHKTERSVVNQIALYQINHSQTGIVFYSLNPEALRIYAFKDYKTVLELLQPFFIEAGKNENDLGYRYGSKRSVESGIGSNGKDRRIVSLKSTDIGESGVEESGSLSVTKVLVDVLAGRGFSTKSELYSYVYQMISSLMETLDRQNFSVLGLFSYHQNHYDISSYEDHLYSRLLDEDNLLRFDYKKKLPLQKLVKFIQYNAGQGRLMEVRAIYNVREVTKLIKISLNFYYKNALHNEHSQQYTSLFKMHYFNQRVFSSKRDLLGWCELNTFKYIKDLATRQASKDMLTSLKRLHDQKEVSIMEILSEKELFQLQNKHKENGNSVNKSKFYRQSPFYNLLRKVGQTVEVLLGVVEYLKVDRRGRFQIVHIKNLAQLIKYYLLNRCLVKDDYIYSQGVSVSMTNLMSLLEEYIEAHPQNCGEERELLQFEKIVRKLADLVKFAEISCTICIHQSLNLEQLANVPSLNDTSKK